MDQGKQQKEALTAWQHYAKKCKEVQVSKWWRQTLQGSCERENKTGRTGQLQPTSVSGVLLWELRDVSISS